MLKGNLSTRPFYNDRLVNGLLLVAALAGLLMAAYSTTRILDLGGERAKRVAAQNTAKSEAARIRTEAEREQLSVNRQTYLLLAIATDEANSLIDERTFSWTVLFGQIEKTIPMDVRLIAVAPRVERAVFKITMTVNGKRPEDLQKFIEGLKSTGSFYDVLATEQSSMEDGTINATIASSYVAPVATPAKTTGARGGPDRP